MTVQVADQYEWKGLSENMCPVIEIPPMSDILIVGVTELLEPPDASHYRQLGKHDWLHYVTQNDRYQTKPLAGVIE